jgi:hypothetical protein
MQNKITKKKGEHIFVTAAHIPHLNTEQEMCVKKVPICRWRKHWEQQWASENVGACGKCQSINCKIIAIYKSMKEFQMLHESLHL